MFSFCLRQSRRESETLAAAVALKLIIDNHSRGSLMRGSESAARVSLVVFNLFYWDNKVGQSVSINWPFVVCRWFGRGGWFADCANRMTRVNCSLKSRSAGNLEMMGFCESIERCLNWDVVNKLAANIDSVV